MNFNKHFALVGQHAFLSASKYSWINYDEEKLDRIFYTAMQTKRGSELHDLAKKMIELGVRPRNSRQTFNMYVNDAIGYRMTPEQVLFYSINIFGTADAISFRKMVLRISDLKTGTTPTSFRQLLVYAALFCLEYGFEPFEIGIELRIYQNDEIRIYEPEAPEVKHIMEKIIAFDKRLEVLKEEAMQ